jgi:hypothetical protein
LAFKSNQKPIPLTELEQILLLTSVAGSTGWHYAISYNETVRSKLLSYSAGPAGRTFPSAAGFHTSDLFLRMITGHATSLLVISTLLQRITEVR